MKKTLKSCKKIIALAICMMMIFSFCVPMSFAANDGVSLNAGHDALRAQFSRDKGPKAGGYAIDYSYFSPVGEDNGKKYPLVIFLPGGSESKYEGQELTANSFCTWSSKEYQARFKDAGGAYIMIARAREDVALSWNSSLLTSGLTAAVKDFIAKHPNVDTDRVYLIGWCYGGTGAINQATAAPELYAGAVFIAPSSGISSSEASKLKNMAVWLDVCKKDSFSLYTTNNSSWSNLQKKTANSSKIRLTTYEDAPDAGVLLHHNCWHDVCYDMQSGSSDYVGEKTVDGNGNRIDVSTEGMISWLSSQTLHHDEPTPTVPTPPTEEPDDSCSCNCHSTNAFTKLFWKLQVFFWKIFGSSSKRQCACGVSHW
ncbi:MAG: dienelactone hydrolase family protein [Faecalibacterium sp.]|nr:dienelactone hydrolase family protein [Ruminococcus sp.]MCM1391337.1 dienelactone hydrolase family protein [Ruminococcus sp.]MCM1484896.1 dienelactone hydrolase family protein [Faecalibacterium sp.]